MALNKGTTTGTARGSKVQDEIDSGFNAGNGDVTETGSVSLSALARGVRRAGILTRANGESLEAYAKKISDIFAAANLKGLTVLALDTPKTGIRVAMIVVVPNAQYLINETDHKAPGVTPYYTLAVESTLDDLPMLETPASETNGDGMVRTKRVIGDVFSVPGRTEIISGILTGSLGQSKYFEAGWLTIPSETSTEDATVMSAIAQAADNTIREGYRQVTNDHSAVIDARSFAGCVLRVSTDMNRSGDTFVNGLPRRTDVLIKLSAEPAGHRNQNNPDVWKDDNLPLGSMSVYTDLMYQVPATTYGSAQLGENWQLYQPMLVINDIETSSTNLVPSMEHILLQLQSVFTLADNYGYLQLFSPNRASKRTFRNIGTLTHDIGTMVIRGDITGANCPFIRPDGNNGFEPVILDGLKDRTYNHAQFCMKILKPGFVTALRIRLDAPNNNLMVEFIRAAIGNQQDQAAANRRILDAADRLTNGQFSVVAKERGIDPGSIRVMAGQVNMLHGGYYEDNDLGRQDLAELDGYVQMYNLLGISDANAMNDYCRSLWVTSTHHEVRKSIRMDLLQRALGGGSNRMQLKSYDWLAVLDPTFMSVLAQATMSSINVVRDGYAGERLQSGRGNVDFSRLTCMPGNAVNAGMGSAGGLAAPVSFFR